MIRLCPGCCGLRLYFALVLTVLSLASPGGGQTLKVQNPGTGVIPLDKDWRFHLGDDKAWADPALDDSSWEPIRVDGPWGQQDHPSYTGFAWYRLRLEIDNSNSAGTKSLAVLIPVVQDAYELYWNGQKLGTYGSLPPDAKWWAFGRETVYPLPSSGGVLALRVWKAPLSSVDPAEIGGFTEAPLLGDASLLAARTQLTSYASDERRLPNLLMSAITLVIGMLSFLLYLRDRKQGLYFWLALYLVASGIVQFQSLSAIRDISTFRTYQLMTQLEICARDISMWLILLSLFGMAQERQWRRVTGWIIAVYLAAQVTDIITIWFWEKGGVLPWIDGITTGIYSITPLYVFVIIGFGLLRRKRLSLWPLIITVCVTALYNVVLNFAGQGIRFTHWTLLTTLSSLGFHFGIYFFNMPFILSTLLFLALIFTIAREQFLERERQARIELEDRKSVV